LRKSNVGLQEFFNGNRKKQKEEEEVQICFSSSNKKKKKQEIFSAEEKEKQFEEENLEEKIQGITGNLKLEMKSEKSGKVEMKNSQTKIEKITEKSMKPVKKESKEIIVCRLRKDFLNSRDEENLILTLEALRFKQSKNDTFLYSLELRDDLCFAMSHDADLIFAATSKKLIETIVQHFKKKLGNKSFGKLESLSVADIEKEEDGKSIVIHTEGEILSELSMEEKKFGTLKGCLLYLAINNCSDVAGKVSILIQNNVNSNDIYPTKGTQWIEVLNADNCGIKQNEEECWISDTNASALPTYDLL
jgi:hypothetical protein